MLLRALPRVGQTLTAGTVSDPDGGVTDTTYQWQSSSDRTTYINIDSATDTLYQLVAEDVGNTLRVIARYTDAEASAKTATSTISAEVAALDAPDAPGIALNTDTGALDTDGITSNGRVDVTLHIDFATGDANFWEHSINNGADFTRGVDTSFILDEGVYEDGQVQVRQNLEGFDSALSFLGAITIDNTPPVITLLGADITLVLGGTYNELGTSVTGASTVTIAGDAVNTDAIGTYVITYNALDTAGNVAIEVRLTVSVVEPSNDASLSNLIVSVGTLEATFASTTLSYNVNVASDVGSITITPTVNDDTASVVVAGNTVTSGEASGVIGLNIGENIITIVVTAENSDTQTYTININRAPVSVTVGYEFNSYESNKDMGSVNYCTTISEPDSGAPAPFILQSSIEGGTAIAGFDYIDAGDVLLEFNTGDNRQCATIIFRDTLGIGKTILFRLTLVSSDPSVVVTIPAENEQSGVVIHGNDATLRELSLADTAFFCYYCFKSCFCIFYPNL